jgi:hypothetical protein
VFVPLVPGREFRLLVANGRGACWVSTRDTPASRREAEAVLVHMTVYWMVQLMEAGLFTRDSGMEWNSITVSYNHENPHTVASDTSSSDGMSLSLGSGFLKELARSDNSADRNLIDALLELAFGSASDAEDVRLREDFIDKLAPLGAGTFTIWNDPSVPELPVPIADIPTTSGTARSRVKLGMTEALRAAGAEGVATGAMAKEWLDAAVAGTIATLEREIAECGPELLERVVGLCELVAVDTETKAIEYPIRAAFGGRNHDLFHEWQRESGVRNGAIRFLVEIAYARSPQGEQRVNKERLDRLRALAEFIVQFAAMSDAAYGGLLEHSIVVPPNGPLMMIAAGEAMGAREAQWRLIADAAPESAPERYPHWWAREDPIPEIALDQPVDLGEAWGEASSAMRPVLGFSLDEFIRVMQAVAAHAVDGRDPVRVEIDDLIRKVAGTTNVEAEVCKAAIDFMASRPDTRYDPLQHPFKPWKSGRDAGYLRRPLLILDSSVLFSHRHVHTSLRLMVRRLQSNRIQFEDRNMRAAASKLRNTIGAQWEDKLYRLVESLEMTVRGRLKIIGGRRVRGEQGDDLGDVDLLALDHDKRLVWALDAKSIASDVTPLSMRSEARQLQEEIPKHQRRVEWLEQNRDAVATEFGLPSQALCDWEIRGALVLEEPLGGVFIFEPALPVLTWTELRSEMVDAPV